MKHRQQDIETDRREDVPFGDLLYLLGEGVAEAQERLDANAVTAARSLAETTIDVVPRITRTIEADGTVSRTTDPPEKRSLLDVGFEPTRYRFEEATVEVAVDASFSESADTEFVGGTRDATDTTDDERRPTLRASTVDAPAQRRIGSEVETNTRLSARLRPTPLPSLSGSTTGAAPEHPTVEDDGGDDAD